MTTDLETISPSYHLVTAKKIMNEKGIRHLPVVQRSKLYGIISDRDIRVAESVYKEKDSREIFIKDIYMGEPYITGEQTLLVDALDQMLRSKIGSVLVVQAEELVGIFTMFDAAVFLKEYLENS